MASGCARNQRRVNRQCGPCRTSGNWRPDLRVRNILVDSWLIFIHPIPHPLSSRWMGNHTRAGRIMTGNAMRFSGKKESPRCGSPTKKSSIILTWPGPEFLLVWESSHPPKIPGKTSSRESNTGLIPIGERVNVSFTFNGQSFRNSIKTRGATSFDKNLFLRDAGKIFACQRFTNVSLVIAEATRAYKQIMFCDGGQVFPETQKVKGFILTKTGHRLGFALDGILTSTKPHNIIEFLNSACRFQPELSPLSVVIGSNHSSPFRVELPGKYISECVISHQTPGGVTSFSTLYADARRFQSESVIEPYESLISGKIISISRKLTIPTDVYDEPRDPHHTKIIQASGRALFQDRLSSLWKLEGIDERCWKRLPELGETRPEPAIQWFLEKHMILSDETGEAAHPDQVIVSRLSQ